ncbi:MAG: hypothetical protein M3P51_18095, partial [Chloroflexota bacterium]|nr:hypothetical protein [Chloroflexota bacterium]
YTVWKWTGSPVSATSKLTFAANRSAVARRIAYWDRKSGSYGNYTLSTPAGWAEVLYRNSTYNYGFASFGSDVYLRMPGNLNPNYYYLWLSGSSTGRFEFDGPNIRLSGFEVRMVGTNFSANAGFGVVDHNMISNAGLSYRGEQGAPSAYPSDHTVQYNLLRDIGTWSTDPSYRAIPWNFIKGNMKIGEQTTGWNRVGAHAETFAIFGRGGARRMVVRRNTIEGYFNGLGGYNEGYDRYSQQDTDVHGNVIRKIADDAFEPEQQAINWRIWGNRIERASVAVSTGPVRYGPIYFFRNEAWKLGREGVGADNSGSKGVGVVGFKYSGSSSVTPRIYVIHNTFWTNASEAGGGAQWAGGGSSPDRFWLRNNIFRMTRYAFEAPSNGSANHWNENYNHFATTDTERGISYAGTRYTTNVSAYRSSSGQGSRTNIRGSFISPGVVDTALAAPLTGSLGLKDGAVFVNSGTPVANISDQASQYAGIAPDLGARESR